MWYFAFWGRFEEEDHPQDFSVLGGKYVFIHLSELKLEANIVRSNSQSSPSQAKYTLPF